MRRPVRGIVVTILASLVMSSALPASAFTAEDGLWYFDWFRLQDVHDSGITGDGVTIAIIDTPVNLELPTLAGADIRPQEPVCVDKQGNGLAPTSTDYDVAFHGTGVLSLLVGSGDGFPGQNGVKGLAPDATVLTFATQVEDKERDCSGSTVDLGIDWGDGPLPPVEMSVTQQVGAALDAAIDQGADIISVSLGVADNTVTVQAIARAVREGVIVVASVPNKVDGSASFPASLNGVVSVNAITQDEETNYSPYTDVVAAGDSLLFQGAQGDWTQQRLAGGTSYATPIIAGNLALAIQKYPEATPNQLIQSLIHNTGDQSAEKSWHPTYGYGLVITDVFLAADPTIYPDVNPLVTALGGQWPKVNEIWPGSVPLDEFAVAENRPWPIYSPVPVAPSPSPSASLTPAPTPDDTPTARADDHGTTATSWLAPAIIVGALVLAVIVAAVIILTARSTRTTGAHNGS